MGRQAPVAIPKTEPLDRRYALKLKQVDEQDSFGEQSHTKGAACSYAVNNGIERPIMGRSDELPCVEMLAATGKSCLQDVACKCKHPLLWRIQ